MPAPGRILRGSLSSVNGANTANDAVVNLSISGILRDNVVRSAGVFAETTI